MLMLVVCELICSAVRKIILKQKHLLNPVTKGEGINTPLTALQSQV